MKTLAPLPFIRVLKHSAVPLSQQVYDQIRNACLRGVIKPGVCLPSSRSLAEDLGLSRNTIVSAFAQLEAEGYIRSEVGRGSIVRQIESDRLEKPAPGAPRRRAHAGAAAPGPQLSERGRKLSANDSTSILRSTPPKPFRMGVPALDEFPSAIWSGLVARRARQARKEHLMYANTAGYTPLRVAIAEYLGAARGVRCTADQIVLVSGAQHALGLLGRLLANPGDVIWMEDPGYLAAKAAFRGCDLAIHPVTIDADGPDIARAARDNPEPKMLYVTPSHQYPLGVTMSISRRLEILRWARARGVIVVEDDYNSEYRYEGRPIPALQGLDESSNVIYVGTFSKVLFPALRIGYMVVPPHLVSPLVFARSTDGVHSFSIEQAALAEFISEGHLGRHVRRMRELYGRRKAALERELRELLPDGAEIAPSSAGMHSLLLLPAGWDDRAIARRAAEKGLEVTALSRYYLSDFEWTRAERRIGLLLGFSGFDEALAGEAARALATLLRSTATRGRTAA